MECDGISIEPGSYVFSGCNGGVDCPICEGTGEMLCCPWCGSEIIEDEFVCKCTLCEFLLDKD